MKSLPLIQIFLCAFVLIGLSHSVSAKSPISSVESHQQKPLTFQLIDGSVITGTVIDESDTHLTVMTRFGETSISKDDLIEKKTTIKLKTGEVVIGTIRQETDTQLMIQGSFGLVTINKTEIADFNESNGNIETKDDKFVLAEDYLIDIFQDPTGNTLQKDTVYISGLSVGYAFTDNLQISTRYDGFFYQNVNIRPKFRILNKGNWQKQLTASVGFHIHSNWHLTNFHKYSEEIPEFCDKSTDPSSCPYRSGYIPITQTPEEAGSSFEEQFMPMLEVFAATSFAKTRFDLKGRLQYTVGASAKFVEGAQSFRTYAAFDIDLNKRLKLISQIIYDPFYDLDSFSSPTILNDVFIDFGLMYTFPSESTIGDLSVGVHMLPYLVTVYWKQ